MSELDMFNQRVDDLRLHIDTRFNDLKSSIDAKCDSCDKIASLREKIRTLFSNVYAIWGVLAAATSSIGAIGWWMFTTYVVKH